MAGVNPKFLISKDFSRHTKAALDLDDDVVLTYYIDDSHGTQSLADGRTITTLPHTTEEVRFIEGGSLMGWTPCWPSILNDPQQQKDPISIFTA